MDVALATKPCACGRASVPPPSEQKREHR
jgi:hypothetical protein